MSPESTSCHWSILSGCFGVLKTIQACWICDWWTVVQSTWIAEYGSGHLLATLQSFFDGVWTINTLCFLLVTSLVWPARPCDVPFTLHNYCQFTMGVNMHHSELCHICPVNFIVKATPIVTYTLGVNSTQMLFGHCQQLKQLVGISPSFIVWMISLARFNPAPCTMTYAFLWPCISTGREEKH